jgi:probable HAF family extracellular repeat protein
MTLAALVLGSSMPAQAGSTTYQVTKLPSLGGSSAVGTAMNNNGQIVGYSTTTSGDTHAVIWNSGVPTDIDPGIDSTGSRALGINSSGFVVGTTSSGHGFIYSSTGTTDLGANTSAYGINDAGDVVGSSNSSAALFSNGTATLLGVLPTAQAGAHSQAYAINNNEQIVGSAYFLNPCAAACPYHAFLWSGGTMTDPGFPGESGGAPGGLDTAVALAINNAGEAVGYAASTGPFAAILWSNGTLTQLGVPAVALAINNSSVIAGYNGNDAALWEGGSSVNLSQQIDPTSPFFGNLMLNSAVAINDSGWVVATQTANSATNTYVLSPQLIAFSPASLSFGGQPVGTASAPQAVTVTNTGTTSFAVTNISASTGFSQTNNCGSTLAAGAACSISVSFAPTASGVQTGTINVTIGTQQSSLNLSGNGTVTVSLNASTSSVQSGSHVTLSWTGTTGATCTPSGGVPGDGWSGSQPASGSIQVTEQVAQLVTYSISCMLGSQSAQASTQVTWTVLPKSGGGGGAVDLTILLGLLTATVRRLRGPLRSGLP